MSDEPVIDEIRLAIPARPEYGRVARIAAAHLALRRDFSLGEIDDLRLCMDEAAIMLIGPTRHPGTLEISYTLRPNEIIVAARAEFEDGSGAISKDRAERFQQIAAELVDICAIDTENGSLELTKRRAAGQS